MITGWPFGSDFLQLDPHQDKTPRQQSDSALLEENLVLMNGKVLQQNVPILNTQGLHMRPAAAFAELARRFQSKVTVTKDGQSVNGQSPLDLMLLVAEQGTELRVEVEGPDAEDALAALVRLLSDLVKEDQLDAPLPPKG